MQKRQDLNEGDADGWMGLIFASYYNHLNIVKYVVRRGAIVDTANNIAALMMESNEGHLDISRFLCESGADLNAADNDRYTALMFASDQGHLAVVRYLT